MNNSSRSSAGTNLALILLTLITGLALGWLLRDTIFDRREPIAALPATATSGPTASPVPPPPTITPPPTVTPSPTVTPPPTATSMPIPPIPTATPTPTPLIGGYIGRVVEAGETLDSIALAAGSSPDVIARYNLLSREPEPGRGLIIPQIAGRSGDLANQPILVQRGTGSRPWVALTLDAGAGAEPTPRMLAALRERGVTITFFLTGKWMRENPDLVRQIVADGHEIANHTFNHPDLRKVDDQTILAELADTEAALQEIVPGATTRPFFRPPYGAYDQRVLQTVAAAGYLPIYWTLDSLDSVGEPKTPEFLLERVTGKLPIAQLPGAIILAHCGSAPTADALPAILDRFAELGIEVRKVSEVLE